MATDTERWMRWLSTGTNLNKIVARRDGFQQTGFNNILRHPMRTWKKELGAVIDEAMQAEHILGTYPDRSSYDGG